MIEFGERVKLTERHGEWHHAFLNGTKSLKVPVLNKADVFTDEEDTFSSLIQCISVTCL